MYTQLLPGPGVPKRDRPCNSTYLPTYLSSIDISNATAEVVGPLTDELQSILSAATTQVSALKGSKQKTILSSSDGTLSVAETADLLAPALAVVNVALADVLAVVNSTPAAAIVQPLLDAVNGELGTLLTTLGPLVNGLLVAVAPLVQGLPALLASLGLPSIALPALLTQLTADLTPITTLLSSIALSNATAEIVGPLTTQLQAILSGAEMQVGALAGSELNTILATATGVLSVSKTAKLLAPALTLVNGALADVSAVVASTPAAAIVQPLLDDVNGVVGSLLVTLGPLVNGLLAAVAPLVPGLTNLLNSLGLGSLLNGVLGGLLGGLL
ncbi:hypothetical protein C8R43DRAFT_1208907 [Mycena crocata]|nr:hypothetical protein C8R43DRAFT_1208907 [Mycena crocata]